MEPTFLCDAMLAKLARWLRMFGYDTELASNTESDLDLLKKARAEQRVLLTRDRRLGVHPGAFLLESQDTAEQMKALIVQFRLELSEDPKPLYCSLCNGRLRDAAPNELPKYVTKGWACTNCGQQYWQGAHWKGIKKFVRDVTNPG